jgi:DNA-binding SARP family transcriptional activator/Tfp pilus assembly protein PilF
LKGLEVALFGHVRLAFDGKPFEFGAPRKTLPILAYLLLHRNAAVSREFLAFLMWPDAEEEVARSNLRRNLTLFKQILPPPGPAESWLLATNELVRWNPDAPFTLDVAEFDRLCGQPASLAEAVELYGGDLLEDLYDDWIYPERERLRAAYLTALKALVRHHRSERDFARAIGYGQRLLAADPLREDVAREIAATRYQAGDRAGALSGLDTFVKRLHADLGIDAMPETQALRESILRGAPTDAPSGEFGEAPAGERRAASAVELPFVGREAPLERAGFLWDQAARGAGAVGFVGGEAGIGKTRFAAELALRAEEQGGRVLIGATTGPEGFPYQAFCEALRAAIPLIVAANLERVWLSVLATVIPELAARVAVDPVPLLRPDEERTRLFEAFTRAFRAIARARPLLLILEDMHWCGAASAELLGFVANHIAGERIALVATYRSEEIVRSHPLRSVRRAFQTRGAALTIELPRLERAAIAQIVGADDADELYARSLGNPLFLGELIREGSERPAPPSATSDADTLPATIESTIAARLARLNDDARRAAGICAVVGDTFDFELLGEVTGWESGVLLDALDELIERHVVRETTRRELGAYAFTHHLIRATAYAELPLEARRRYHGVVARAIGALYATQPDAWAPELARHYESAGEALSAAGAWLRAARAALRAYANAEGVAAATRGLTLYRSCGDLRGEFEALLILIDERIAANRYEENRADLERAAELARAAADPLMSARLLQSAMMEPIMKQDFPSVHRMAGDLLDLARATGDRQGEGRAYERRATAANRMFSIAEAIEGYGKALAIYESIGEERGIRSVENNWGSLDVALGMVARGRERLLRLLDSATAEGDLRMQYFAVSNLGVAASFDGDFGAAKSFELQALELARRLGSDAFAALVLGDLGVAERELGNLDAALAHLEEAVEIHRRLDQRLELSTNLARLALVHVKRGDVERARDIAHDLVAHERAHPELVEDSSEVLWNAAQALHACGDEREAREVVERAARLQEARLAAIDLPEYRESAAGLRWYRALLGVRSAGVWPGEDGRATPVG